MFPFIGVITVLLFFKSDYQTETLYSKVKKECLEFNAVIQLVD